MRGWIFFVTGALCVAAQETRMVGPAELMAGQPAEFWVVQEDKGIVGAEIRVLAPTQLMGVVTADRLTLRTEPDVTAQAKAWLYRDDAVLVFRQGNDGWCEVAGPTGARGFVLCEHLSQRPYGQPLGVTDATGKLVTTDLALAPSKVELGVFVGPVLAARSQIAIRPLEFDRTEAVAPGIIYRERRWQWGDDGPFTMQILQVDPAHPAVNLLPARAHDRAIGRETVSSLARRYGAVAAVNGGYFLTKGVYEGAAAGAYQLHREIIAGGSGRTALIFCEEDSYQEHVEMEVVHFRGIVTAQDGSTISLTGINRTRATQDAVVYTARLGDTTLTSGQGTEAATAADSRVLAVVDGADSAIPPGGRVLSGSGAAAAWIRNHLKPGDIVSFDLKLELEPPPLGASCRPVDIVGAGPRLVRNGQVAVSAEGFGHEFARHPRTAVAVTQEGKLLFVTVDGRQSRSVGMRLEELAAELVAMGAIDAINLDGGGSTTMVVNGQLRNSPSDGAERPVGDAILIYSVSTREQLGALIERLGEDPAQIAPEALEALQAGLRSPTGLAEMTQLVEAWEGRLLSPSAARLIREGIYAVVGASRTAESAAQRTQAW